MEIPISSSFTLTRELQGFGASASFSRPDGVLICASEAFLSFADLPLRLVSDNTCLLTWWALLGGENCLFATVDTRRKVRDSLRIIDGATRSSNDEVTLTSLSILTRLGRVKVP